MSNVWPFSQYTAKHALTARLRAAQDLSNKHAVLALQCVATYQDYFLLAKQHSESRKHYDAVIKEINESSNQPTKEINHD